jgi:hypothetical protein
LQRLEIEGLVHAANRLADAARVAVLASSHALLTQSIEFAAVREHHRVVVRVVSYLERTILLLLLHQSVGH